MSEMLKMVGMLGSGGMASPAPMARTRMPANPFQRVQMVMSAMNNPFAYLKQKFPDIPNEYAGQPDLIMQYLQQTRGITAQDIQDVQSQIPQGGMHW